MLTREHAVFEYRGGKILPDRLTRVSHGQYLELAERMLEIYRKGTGSTRQELHRAIHRLFEKESECPMRRIASFCKLLDDASTYDHDAAGQAAALRARIFSHAAPLQPLVSEPDRFFESSQHEVKLKIARELNRPWGEIARSLFADVIEFHQLAAFAGYPSAEALLSRYNVAQVQVALYRAREMRITAGQDFKAVLRYARLAGLMHTIRHLPGERYEIRLDGPASVIRHTRRYGVAMARFLPAVLTCRDWQLRAVIETARSGRAVALEISSRDGLRSHRPPPAEFDSQLEENFARKWGDQPRSGWSLVREGEILISGQKTFVPDFVLRHEDGRRVLLEIVGFWTPDYLNRKLDTLNLFRKKPILLAVAGNIDWELPALPRPVVFFKTVLKVNDVLRALDEFCFDRKGP